MQQLRRAAVETPEATYRMSVYGPEQTTAEFLAEIDADEAFIRALRDAAGDDGFGERTSE